MNFSVLVSVYHGELPAYLARSLDSLVSQTLPADQVVIVKDGPLGEGLEGVLAQYLTRLPITFVELERNRGLSEALQIGLDHCRFDLIARMDTDDVCAAQRFEKQVDFLARHPEIDVLGSSIVEFDTDPSHRNSIRCPPERHDEIRAFAQTRCPMNHVTVMYRKQAVLAAGGYRPVGLEDYDLWVRMLMNGSRFHNLSEPLVFVCCGSGMQGRRGGLAYARREIALFWSFRKAGFLTLGGFLCNILRRTPLRLLPRVLRSWVYRDFLRRLANE